MPSEQEREILLNRFDGTNLLLDASKLGPSYLRQTQNWIPGDTYRLQKTPGTIAYPGGNIPSALRIPAMIRCYASDGSHRYLYAVRTPIGGGVDDLWVSIDDGAWAHVQLVATGNAVFTQIGGNYAMDVMNDVLYIGNGVDSLMVVNLVGTLANQALSLTPIKSFTDTEAGATVTADPGAQILTGSYSYVWCIFDHTNKIWVGRGTTQTITNGTSGDASLSFPLASWSTADGTTMGIGAIGAPTSRYRAHLLVAPVNYPVEFAHDQTPEGLTSGSFVLRALVADGQALPLGGSIARTGRALRWHHGRLWLGIDSTQPTAVWATSPIVPGLEQAIFNSGVFFPVNGRIPRTQNPVTALGLCMTTENANPQDPIAIFTLSTTTLWYGDILDDPAAFDVRVSSKVGCIGSHALTETPEGLFFVSLRSVYMIPEGGGPPQDVGWPIRPDIEKIPPGSRERVICIYHKGFLKVAIVSPGGTMATIQWWLDLRRGLTPIPSWWGPHIRVPVSAWCVADADDAEPDRAFHVIEGTGVVEVIHQINSLTENLGTAGISTTLRTGDLDDGQPFVRKIFTRLRATAFVADTCHLTTSIEVDGGPQFASDAMEFLGSTGAEWGVFNVGLAEWNVALWTQPLGKTEGESVLGNPDGLGERPFGMAATIVLGNIQACAISIRDLALRYLPVVRPTRAIDTDASS